MMVISTVLLPLSLNLPIIRLAKHSILGSTSTFYITG